MALSKEVASIELALTKIYSFKQIISTEENTQFSMVITAFLEQLHHFYIDSSLSSVELLNHLLKLRQYGIIMDDIPIIAECLTAYPEILKLINQKAIELKDSMRNNVISQIQAKQARGTTCNTNSLSPQIVSDLKNLCFLSSLLPIFHAPNDMLGIFEKRVSYLFVIAQIFPEIVIELIRSTKLRLHQGGLFNYLLGSYFLDSFVEQILLAENLEIVPPKPDKESMEEYLNDSFKSFRNIVNMWCDQLFAVSGTKLTFGAIFNNHVVFPFLILRVRREFQAKIDHFKKTAQYNALSTKELDLFSHESSLFSKEAIEWPDVFKNFTEKLHEAIIKIQGEPESNLKSLNFEIISYKMITAYRCDPQPELLQDLASLLMKSIASNSTIGVKMGLATLLATAYRLLRSQQIIEPQWSDASKIDSLLFAGATASEPVLLSATKSYAFGPYSQQIHPITTAEILTASPNQIAMMSARIQYLYDSSKEIPEGNYYQLFCHWLTNLDGAIENEPQLLFEMLYLLYTLTFAHYSEEQTKIITALIDKKLKSATNAPSINIMLAILEVLGVSISDKPLTQTDPVLSLISECRKRYNQLMHLHYDYLEHEKSTLVALAPMLPSYTITLNSASLHNMSFTMSDPALFSTLTRRNSRVCPITSKLNEHSSIINELVINVLQLLGVVDKIKIKGIDCIYDRLKIYWNNVTEYLSATKLKIEYEEIKVGVLKKLILALWLDLINKDLPEDSHRLFTVLIKFMGKQGDVHELISSGIAELYDNLFTKNSLLFDLRKDNLFILMQSFISLNLELSSNHQNALERLGTLRRVYGKEKADGLFAIVTVSGVIAGVVLPVLRQKSTSGPPALVYPTIGQSHSNHRSLSFFLEKPVPPPTRLIVNKTMEKELVAKAAFLQKVRDTRLIKPERVLDSAHAKSEVSEAVLLAEKFRLMRLKRAGTNQNGSLSLSPLHEEPHGKTTA